MAHKYITVSTAFLSDHGSAARTERIRQHLEAARAFHRAAEAGSYDAMIAAKNIVNLETALERAEANEAARTAQKQERRQAETAKAEAKQEQEQAALESELRSRYNLALPRPVTDQEWETVKASVLHRHAMREMERTDHLVAATAQRYRI